MTPLRPCFYFRRSSLEATVGRMGRLRRELQAIALPRHEWHICGVTLEPDFPLTGKVGCMLRDKWHLHRHEPRPWLTSVVLPVQFQESPMIVNVSTRVGGWWIDVPLQRGGPLSSVLGAPFGGRGHCAICTKYVTSMSIPIRFCASDWQTLGRCSDGSFARMEKVRPWHLNCSISWAGEP
jgi:hypothetical protein